MQQAARSAAQHYQSATRSLQTDARDQPRAAPVHKEPHVPLTQRHALRTVEDIRWHHVALPLDAEVVVDGEQVNHQLNAISANCKPIPRSKDRDDPQGPTVIMDLVLLAHGPSPTQQDAVRQAAR